MTRSGALFAVCFVAGMLGALVSVLFLWGCDEWGILRFIGVKMSQSLNQADVQAKMFIGGFWGLGYFFCVGTPRNRRHWIRKGLWFSLLPTLFALFYVQPYRLHNGLAGFNLGMLTPVLITLTNLIWGFFTGFFTRLFWGR